MSEEFFFLPEALRNVTKAASIKALLSLGCVLMALFVVYLTGWRPELLSRGQVIFVMVILYLIGNSVYSARQRHLGTRIFITSEVYRSQRKNSEMKLPLTSIRKIQRRSNGMLLVFSEFSERIPVFTIARLKEQDRFLDYLRPYAPVVDDDRVPFRISAFFRNLQFVLFFFFFTLVFIAQLPEMIWISGLILVAYFVYVLIQYLFFRKIYSSPMGWFTAALLLIIVVLRLGQLWIISHQEICI